MNQRSDKTLLRQSLPLARQWARTLCRHVDDSGISCAPFHEIWQLLRYLELNTTPAEHQTFFLEEICQAIKSGARRVLISGTADYAMLEVVTQALRASGTTLDITVTDVCETPLRLCEWYAGKERIPIRTVSSDILAFQDGQPFDMICTHSFLGLFDPSRRLQLASKWFSLLAPNGRVISVNRLRPGVDEKVSFSVPQADAFVRTTCDKLATSDLAGIIDAKEMADLAHRYIRHRVVFPLRDESEIREMFAATGFRMAHLSTATLADESAGAPSGPTLRGGACYAFFSAIRPA